MKLDKVASTFVVMIMIVIVGMIFFFRYLGQVTRDEENTTKQSYFECLKRTDAAHRGEDSMWCYNQFIKIGE